MLSAPEVVGLPEGFYPLTPSAAGRARFGFLSAGSVGDTVLVYRSVAGFRRGVAFDRIVSGSEIAGPALATVSRSVDGDVTTVTVTGVDGEVWSSHRERRSPSPYGGVRVEILP